MIWNGSGRMVRLWRLLICESGMIEIFMEEPGVDPGSFFGVKIYAGLFRTDGRRR